MLFEELVPLWFTSTRASGGLDFSPPQIGLFLLIMGTFLKVEEEFTLLIVSGLCIVRGFFLMT